MINKIHNDSDYMDIIEDILNKKDFKKLEYIEHHNTNRLEHSLKVSYYSYKIAKMIFKDYDEVARGGLLHDFFEERTIYEVGAKAKFDVYTKHSTLALNNSLKHYELTKKEQDMIKSHMFPLDTNIPRYKESWLVNTVDTFVSVYEFSLKFKYKLNYAANFTVFLLLNLFK